MKKEDSIEILKHYFGIDDKTAKSMHSNKKILGVVPAAGKGSRWGGYFKEFLPLDGSFLIDRAIEATFRGGADKCLVISNKDKLSAHKFHLEGKKNIIYGIQEDFKKDLWGAIEVSLDYNYDTFLFVMPDTLIPMNTFNSGYYDLFTKPFSLGTIMTKHPERMGCININNGRVGIYDKPEKWDTTYAEAWGTVVWSKKVAQFWRDNKDLTNSFTHAMNNAIDEFGVHLFSMKYYYDMASWEDYEELIWRRK